MMKIVPQYRGGQLGYVAVACCKPLPLSVPYRTAEIKWGKVTVPLDLFLKKMYELAENRENQQLGPTHQSLITPRIRLLASGARVNRPSHLDRCSCDRWGGRSQRCSPHPTRPQEAEGRNESELIPASLASGKQSCSLFLDSRSLVHPAPRNRMV